MTGNFSTRPIDYDALARKTGAISTDWETVSGNVRPLSIVESRPLAPDAFEVPSRGDAGGVSLPPDGVDVPLEIYNGMD